jgi:hypothetical protein
MVTFRSKVDTTNVRKMPFSAKSTLPARRRDEFRLWRKVEGRPPATFNPLQSVQFSAVLVTVLASCICNVGENKARNGDNHTRRTKPVPQAKFHGTPVSSLQCLPSEANVPSPGNTAGLWSPSTRSRHNAGPMPPFYQNRWRGGRIDGGLEDS